ncbi:acyl-CoA dehydrogenase family protein [Streptomyces sp. NPDC048518]|uniref:acyl-CoA dehydrogenase family protein n=1 Tax=Streptomyces sp. NPDC048518 TaxID=3155029 RepID=UPI0033D9016D
MTAVGAGEEARRAAGSPPVAAESPTVTGATPSAFEGAARLESALGCPFDPGSGMSLAGGLRADEHESEPAAAYEAAWAAGLHRHLVPVSEGGALASFEAFAAVARVVSRRDLAVSVGFGSTLLAATPVWVWGTEDQRRRVADLVLGRAWGTAGISEEAAGSDLLATATRAVPDAGGHVLDGTKWLVGNGSRSAFATVLAACDPSYGLFLLDFEAIGGHGVRRLPKVRTHGLRGHDLSGFALDGCRVGADAVLGRPGRGIEMVSGMLQFTRTLVGASSLGAADTALRVALRHARDRVLYGRPALALPPVRSLLARAFTDLLIAECTELAAARGLDVARRRMALWSAVAKYAVPRLCVDAVHACGEVLSARAHLREGVAGGAFQKLLRDVSVTPVFEGTELVQLDTVRAQLAAAARRPRGPAQVSLPLLFGFGDPAPSPAPRELRPALTFGGADEIVDSLDEAVQDLADDAELGPLGRTLLAVRDENRAAFRALGTRRTTEAYEAARTHCLVHTAACVLHTWRLRGGSLDGLAAERHWVSLALRRVLARLGRPVAPDPEAEDLLVRHLVQLDDGDRAFSLVPLRIAPQYRD